MACIHYLIPRSFNKHVERYHFLFLAISPVKAVLFALFSLNTSFARRGSLASVTVSSSFAFHFTSQALNKFIHHHFLSLCNKHLLLSL